jgi:membrane fusion protein, multidrug efflux system
MDVRAPFEPQETKSEDETRAPRPRRGRLILFVLLVVAGAVVWRIREAPPPQNPAAGRSGRDLPTQIVAASVQKGDIHVSLTALGTVTSLATVTIKTQISGQLTKVAFKEGQDVKKGDPLVEIDSRPYALALEQAQGTLAKDSALLEDAQLDLARYEGLAKTNAIPRQQLDTQRALVHQYQGNVSTDQAQIDTAKLNISYCHIVAPIDGRVGLRLVDAGNYATPSDANGIVVITQITPISVLFSLPQADLPVILKLLGAGAPVPVTAYDSNGVNALATGELTTADSQIDTATGTIKLRAQFANDKAVLYPNQFVNISVLTDTLKDVATLPVAAVQHGVPGSFVYLISADQTVSVRTVETGPSEGGMIAVTAGLAAGDQVVLEGADKLREGAKISLRQPGAATGGSRGRAGAGEGPGAPTAGAGASAVGAGGEASAPPAGAAAAPSEGRAAPAAASGAPPAPGGAGPVNPGSDPNTPRRGRHFKNGQ